MGVSPKNFVTYKYLVKIWLLYVFKSSNGDRDWKDGEYSDLHQVVSFLVFDLLEQSNLAKTH